MNPSAKPMIVSLLIHSALVIGAAGWAFRPAGNFGQQRAGEEFVSLFLDENDPAPAGEMSDVVELPRDIEEQPDVVPALEFTAAELPPAPLLNVITTASVPVTPSTSIPVTLQRRVITRGTGNTARGPGNRGGTGKGSGRTAASYLPARYDRCPPPPFPASARKQGITGTTLLFVQIDAEGCPTLVRVRRSSGHDSLDSAAVDAVRRWRFEPARLNGSPVAAKLEVPIRFARG